MEGVQELPPVVARVGEFDISGAALQRRMVELWQRQGRDGALRPPGEELREQALAELVREAYLALLVKRANPTVPEEAVREELTAFKASFETPDAYLAYLENTGQSEQDVAGILRRRLAYETFYQGLVEDREVTEEERRAAYERLKMERILNRPVRTADIAQVAAVANPQDGAALARAHERIQKAHERLQAGEDFAAVAREMSDDRQTAPKGGVLDEVAEEALLPAFAAQLRGMEPGDVSEPFRSREGWHIVKLLGYNNPGVVPYEKALPLLDGAVLDHERNRKLDALLEEIREETPPELIRVERGVADEEGKTEDGAKSED